jgi:hypothetical protein
MKRTKLNQSGFIPMMLSILSIVIVVIYLVFSRVQKAIQ